MTLLSLLPEWPPAMAMSLALDAAVCSGLISQSALEPLRGKTIAIEVRDLGVRVRLEYARHGFRPYAGTQGTDVTIKAGVKDYLSLALRREDPDTLFFNRRLVITGDTDLGLIVKNALDAIDWSRLPAYLRRS